LINRFEKTAKTLFAASVQMQMFRRFAEKKIDFATGNMGKVKFQQSFFDQIDDRFKSSQKQTDRWVDSNLRNLKSNKPQNFGLWSDSDIILTDNQEALLAPQQQQQQQPQTPQQQQQQQQNPETTVATVNGALNAESTPITTERALAESQGVASSQKKKRRRPPFVSLGKTALTAMQPATGEKRSLEGSQDDPTAVAKKAKPSGNKGNQETGPDASQNGLEENEEATDASLSTPALPTKTSKNLKKESQNPSNGRKNKLINLILL
jgi:hypothetical protein